MHKDILNGNIKIWGLGKLNKCWNLQSSCGDDGRIRGWKWKELEEAETPIHEQGDMSCFMWAILSGYFSIC